MQRRHRKWRAKRADHGTRVAMPPEAAPVARLQPSLSSTGTTMKHHAWISGSLALATCLLAGPVRAAPYCISNQGLLPLCIYDDPAECQQEASRQNAQCSPNTATVHCPARTAITAWWSQTVPRCAPTPTTARATTPHHSSAAPAFRLIRGSPPSNPTHIQASTAGNQKRCGARGTGRRHTYRVLEPVAAAAGAEGCVTTLLAPCGPTR